MNTMNPFLASLLLPFILIGGMLLPNDSPPTSTNTKEGIEASCLDNKNLSAEELSMLEFDILMEFYNSTDGPNWTNNTNWGSTLPLNEWYGVTASSTVTRIKLSNNNLTGEIPPSLGDLASLNFLELTRNNLTGEIPSSFGNLTSLTDLRLFLNNLTGEIPPSVGDVTSLKFLELSNNDFTGEIPSSLGNLTSLTGLYLNDNNLTGEIPPSLGDLTSVTNLYLYNNTLTGEIPPSLGNLTSVTRLFLYSNSLTGEIPSSLGDLASLERLRLSNNDLTGEIPSSFGNLTSLTFLYLNENNLTGEIPPSLGDLTSLIRLYLNDNDLTGEIPSSLGNLTSLAFLELSNNDLSGSFPYELYPFCSSSTSISAIGNDQMTEDDFAIFCNTPCQNFTDAGSISYPCDGGNTSGVVATITGAELPGPITICEATAPSTNNTPDESNTIYRWEYSFDEGATWEHDEAQAFSEKELVYPDALDRTTYFRRGATHTSCATTNEFIYTEPLIFLNADKADFIILNESVDLSGSVLDFSFQISNIGTVQSPQSVAIKYFLSRDADPETVREDNPIGGRSYTYLDVGESSPILQHTFDLSNFSSGQYYLVIEVNGTQNILELDYTNNITFLPINYLGNGNGFNLTFSSTSIVTNQAEAGDVIRGNPKVLNDGDNDIEQIFHLKCYLSESPNLLSNDYIQLEGSYYYGAIASGDVASIIVNLPIPDNVPAGYYYFIFHIDDSNQIHETNEDDNISSIPLTIGDPSSVGDCENFTDAGELSYDGFSGFVDELDPNVIVGTVPTGGIGGATEYQWEEKINVGSWNAISNATAQNYNPPLLTETHCYRRKARVNCQLGWVTTDEFCFISCVDETNITGNNGEEKNCTLISDALQINITNSCAGEKLGSIRLEGLPNSNYKIFWNTGERDLRLNDLHQGTYCVTIIDSNVPDCSHTGCYTVEKDTDCERREMTNTLIINELSNGLGYGGEYIELLVVGQNNCETVDIRGFILDDNNGDFSKDEISGTGVAPGHIRFSHSEVLKKVPVGSLILIYNPAYKNENIILEDDPMDANDDGVYVIPIDDSILLGNQDSPSLLDLDTYEYSNNFQVASWNSIWLYDYADAMQIRNPDGSYHHGLSYGMDLLMQGGPDNLHIHPSNFIDKVISFSGGDYLAAENFDVDFRYNNIETPGFPNNEENMAYISSLCDNVTSNEEVVDNDFAFNLYPNPFEDIFYIEIHSDKVSNTQMEIYDLLGKQILSRDLQLNQGYNKVTLNLSNEVSNGTYFLIIKSSEEHLINQKIICIK